MGAQRGRAPVLTGSVPPLAPFYHARQETGFGLADGLRPGETILLVPALLGDRAGRERLSSRSGSRTRCGRRGRLTCWSGFPRATGARSSPATRGRPRTWNLLAGEERGDATADGAAQRFLDWLRTTERRWAVVLDGVASPVDVDGLWPQGPGRAGRRDQPAAGIGARRLRRARDRPRRRRVQQAGGARLPQYPADRLPRPADRGARPGRGPRRAADRARAGRRGGHRGREHLQGLPGRVRAAAADHRARRSSTAARSRCSPPGRSRSSTPTSCRLPACPGLPWCSPPPLTPAGSRPRCSPPRRVRLHHRPGQTGQHAAGNPMAPGAQAWCGPPTPTWSGSACSAWTRPHARGRSGCTRRCGPRSAPTWRPPTSSRRSRRRPRRWLEAWPEAGATGSGLQLSQALRDCAAALHAFARRPAVEAGGPPGAAAGRERRCTEAAGAGGRRHRGTGRRSSATSSQLLGYGHAQSVLARDRLADAYAASGRLAEALPVFEAALADREAEPRARSTRRR